MDINKNDPHPIPTAEKEVQDYLSRHPSMVEGVAKMHVSQPEDVLVTLEGNEDQSPDMELNQSQLYESPGPCLSISRDESSTSLCLEPDSVEFDAERYAKHCRSDLVPSAPDFLMSYSTLPGSLSYRDTTEGSFYIKALDEMLRQWSQHMALDRILMNVTKEVQSKIQDIFPQRAIARHQYPFHLQTTDKLIYLKFD